MRATCIAPSNIAFIKYWGNKKPENLRIPVNGSLSMNLSDLTTTTTVEFSPDYDKDYIEINGQCDSNESSRASEHLDRIRALANIKESAKVVSNNNFPTATGLSSSASGFAALSMAGAQAAGLNLSKKQLSVLARQGSGSACRSIPDGFVEWIVGDSSETSYATSLFPSEYWDIADVVAIVSQGRKDVTTTEGHQLAGSSPFLDARTAHMPQKISRAKQLIAEKDFPKLGELAEAEALELHAIMLTSQPSLIYWTPGTLEIMKLTKKWRTEGLSVYFTINTGQDIHLICQSEDVQNVKAKLTELADVKDIIVNRPAPGARLVNDHLF